MAWTNLPADETTDWTHVDFLNQFKEAINERRYVIGQPLLSYYEDGDQVQSAPGFLQQNVQALASSFVRSAAFPNGFDHETSILRYNGAAIRAAAGLHEDGFTRKFPRTIASVSSDGSAGERAYLGTEDSATTRRSRGATRAVYEHNGTTWVLASDQSQGPDIIDTEHGVSEEGDYIGPWIWNEMKAVLAQLRWTEKELVAFQSGAFIADREYWTGSMFDVPQGQRSPYQAMYDHAAADWSIDDDGAPAFSAPYSECTARYFGGSSGDFSVFLESALYKFTVPTVSGLACSCDMYALLEGPASSPNDFDASALGLDDSYEDCYYLSHSLPALDAPSRVSDWIGSSSVPAIAPNPVGQGGSNVFTYHRSFSVVAVLKWDVDGGFEYLD